MVRKNSYRVTSLFCRNMLRSSTGIMTVSFILGRLSKVSFFFSFFFLRNFFFSEIKYIVTAWPFFFFLVFNFSLDKFDEISKTGFRAIGSGIPLSTVAALFINISLSGKTRPVSFPTSQNFSSTVFFLIIIFSLWDHIKRFIYIYIYIGLFSKLVFNKFLERFFFLNNRKVMAYPYRLVVIMNQ